MLKFVVGVFVAGWIVFSFVQSSHEADQQSVRTSEQAKILEDLEALHKPSVSRLVDEWRETYSSPSDEKLTELRVLAERVKGDPSGAGKYTAEAKQKKWESQPFSSPFGTPKAKPGIG